MDLHDLMVIISASTAFWLLEFLILVCIRVYQVRGEFWNWCETSPERRRMDIMLLGLGSYMTFAFLQRSKAAWSWFHRDWMTPDNFTLIYHGFLIGLPAMLWWAFSAVTANRGHKVWLASMFAGVVVGILGVIMR